MKKLTLIALCILFASCEKYSKVCHSGHDVTNDKITYHIRIYRTGIIERDMISYLNAETTGDPCKMADSLNAVADTLIAKLTRLDDCK